MPSPSSSSSPSSIKWPTSPSSRSFYVYPITVNFDTITGSPQLTSFLPNKKSSNLLNVNQQHGFCSCRRNWWTEGEKYTMLKRKTALENRQSNPASLNWHHCLAFSFRGQFSWTTSFGAGGDYSPETHAKFRGWEALGGAGLALKSQLVLHIISRTPNEHTNVCHHSICRGLGASYTGNPAGIACLRNLLSTFPCIMRGNWQLWGIHLCLWKATLSQPFWGRAGSSGQGFLTGWQSGWSWIIWTRTAPGCQCSMLSLLALAFAELGAVHETHKW